MSEENLISLGPSLGARRNLQAAIHLLAEEVSSTAAADQRQHSVKVRL